LQLYKYYNYLLRCVGLGDTSSVVKSHFTEDGLWSGSIRTTDDLYVVEVVLYFLFNSAL